MTKKTEYALMILKYMDAKPVVMTSTAREISNSLHIPYDTTAKIMQSLKHENLLKSLQGVKGGYLISKSLSDISYLEFTRLLGEKGLDLECLHGVCERESSCNIYDPMKKLNKALITFFNQLSLKEILT